MTSSVCLARLRKELREIQKKTIENIRTAPRETNLLEWHYVIEGPKGSPYEGGWFHGLVTFPKEYPYKPPSLQMFTPNGRFKPNTRLCLSMSDFHPGTSLPLCPCLPVAACTWAARLTPPRDLEPALVRGHCAAGIVHVHAGGLAHLRQRCHQRQHQAQARCRVAGVQR